MELRYSRATTNDYTLVFTLSIILYSTLNPIPRMYLHWAFACSTKPWIRDLWLGCCQFSREKLACWATRIGSTVEKDGREVREALT